jgi:hypothetical protein
MVPRERAEASNFSWLSFLEPLRHRIRDCFDRNLPVIADKPGILRCGARDEF